jgi:hypothetical protein
VSEQTTHVMPDAPRQLTTSPAEQARKSAAWLSTRDLQDLTFESTVKMVVRRIRAILEDGDRLSSENTELMAKLSDADKDALRNLRRRMIERDLYEQLYGALPFAVSIDGEVNPETA